MSIKQSLHISINFSHIHHEHLHISLIQNFHNANTPKIQTKIHPTISQITYIVKISKVTNILQIAPWKKNTSRMLQSQHFQTWSIIQCPKFQNNQMTISCHETFNKTCNNIFPSKETKEKLPLVSTWQYEAWVLGSWRSPSSSFQSNVGWYFLPWKARKEYPLGE